MARELIELLQELRIILPGVQVLFAFLLTVPFAGRFTELTAVQRYVFFGTLLCTAAATALLIALRRTTGCCSARAREGIAEDG